MNLPMNPQLSESRVLEILEKRYLAAIEPGVPDRVAIIVNHGMGQQVPFETLELVAEAVWRAASEPTEGLLPPVPGHPPATFTTGAHPAPLQPEIRTVRLGTEDKNEVETELTRVEMTFADANERQHEVHFYEAYWAPLTEGKVKISDVIAFLFQSGWDGLRNSGIGRCRRWMFGQWQEFNLNAYKQCGLYLYVILLAGSLVILNSVIASAAASHAINGSGAFPGKHLDALTSDFLIADIVGFFVFLATFALPRVYKTISGKQIPSTPLVWVEWLLMVPGILVLPLLGYVMLFQLLGFTPETQFWPLVLSSAVWIDRWPLIVSILWGLLILGAAGVRWALIEYGGDVAAYVAAHTVSRFWELRKQIWQTAMKVTRAVYRTQNAAKTDFYYSRIIMVGHSLGSVIAYDALNGMLLEEGFSADPLGVTARTPMFITFGSPLDKIAFVFRTQADADSEIREVAAAAVQPMIASYNYRPQEWVNIYSRADVFNDPLEYYDEDDGHRNPANRGKRVWNLEDPEARTPLLAHTEYWHGTSLATQLYRAITR